MADKPETGQPAVPQLDELAAMEQRLATLRSGLQTTETARTARLTPAGVNTAPADSDVRDGSGSLLYTFPWTTENELSTAELRALLLMGNMAHLSVHAGQLVAAALADGAAAVQFEAGENVLYADNGRRLFAAVEGLVRWQGEKVRVSPIRRIDGDATAQHGTIATPGSIIVTGSVEDGVTLQADGNIIVEGTVGRATLSAGGTVLVKKGIRGGSKGKVTAGQDIFAGFAESASLEADNNIIIDEALMHCTVKAGEKIVCVGLKGLVVGGTLQAGSELNCRDLGSGTGAETVVLAAPRGADKEALELVRSEMQRLRAQFEPAQQLTHELLARKRAGAITPEAQEQLDAQLAIRNRCEEALERLAVQEARLAEQVKNPVAGTVCVAGTAFPGVKLTIGRSDVLTLAKAEKRVGFVERGGRVTAETYHDPRVVRPRGLINLAATGDAPAVDFAEHAARVQRLRKVMRLQATDEAQARRQAALFTGLPENALLVFPLPAPKRKTGEGAAPAPFLAVQTVAGENPAALERLYVPGSAARKTSVDITCDEIPAGLKQASAALGRPVELLQYRVVQEKSKGVFGVGQKPYIIAVSVKPPKRDAARASDALAQASQNEDGSFLITNADHGLLLAVRPAHGTGKKVEAAAVKAELTSRGYSRGIDMKLLAETVKEASGLEVVIAPRQPEAELDGKFTLEISRDRLQCTVTVTAAKLLGRAVTAAEVLEKLAEKGIRRIDTAAVSRLFSEGRYGEPVVVAQGIAPVPGQDGRIEMKVAQDRQARPAEDANGRVDFRELNLIENVTAGQLLAVLHPPVAGTPGLDIFDSEIAVKPPRGVQVKCGRNVASSADGREIVATADGQLVQMGTLLKVEPVHYVAGDVNLETGNITFFGSVVVKGCITEGFTVRASGNITAGSVSRATLDAEGDVIVLGGIIGAEGTQVKAGRDIRAKFAESATLVAGRHVVISETILHSEVSAGHTVHCATGKKGVIVGGTIRAARTVFARELGAEVATRTVIEVGLDPTVRLQVAELTKMLEDYQTNYTKVATGLKVLTELKAKAGALPPAKEELLLQLQAASRNLTGRLAKLEAQQAALQQKLGERSEGRIGAMAFLHPGCRLTVRNATLNIEEKLSRCTFAYDQGEVRMTEYSEVRPPAPAGDDETDV